MRTATLLFLCLLVGCAVEVIADPTDCHIEEGLYVLSATRLTGACSEQFGAAIAIGDMDGKICKATMTPQKSCMYKMDVSCVTDGTQFEVHGLLLNMRDGTMDGRGIMKAIDTQTHQDICKGTYDYLLEKQP